MRHSIQLWVLSCFLFTMLGCAAAGNTAGSKYPTIGKIESIGKVHIAYGDLDLNDPADLQVLLARVQQAAYEACGGNPKSHRTYTYQRHRTIKVYEECRANAVDTAVSDFGFVPLSRLYRESQSRNVPPCCCEARRR